MNADACKAVSANIDVGIEVRHLWVIAGSLIGGGIVLLGGGLVLAISAARRRP